MLIRRDGAVTASVSPSSMIKKTAEKPRVRVTAGAVVSAIAAVALVVPGAAANSTVPASGSFALTVTPVKIAPTPQWTAIIGTVNETLSGTIAGTRTGQIAALVMPDGTFEALDSGPFTGTVAGRTGTALITVPSSGVFGVSVTGRFVLSGGHGGLTGVNATGTLTGQATGPTSYAGTYSGVVELPEN
jgi:hypothetical protein